MFEFLWFLYAAYKPIHRTENLARTLPLSISCGFVMATVVTRQSHQVSDNFYWTPLDYHLESLIMTTFIDCMML